MILQAVMTLTRGIALDCSCRDNPHIHDAALVIRVRLRQHAVYRLLHQRAGRITLTRILWEFHSRITAWNVYVRLPTLSVCVQVKSHTKVFLPL